MKTIKISLVLAALCLYGIFTASPVLASVNDDQVTSQKIKEADGTSGQNTNSGSGVKTGHIQDGAVTDTKISGPISASKIQKPAKVIIVAKSGGDFTDPAAAIDSITDASAANPYLVKIMPGVYDIGPGGMVSLKDFVDIEGSGKEVTKITKTSSGGNPTVGHDLLAPPYSSEIRDVTVEKISSGAAGGIDTFAIGIGGGTPKYTNINIVASGGSMAIGVYATNAAPVFREVSITATGNPAMGTQYAQGVLLSGAGPSGLPYIFDNLSVSASGATSNSGIASAGDNCVVLLKNSTIYGSTWGVEAGNPTQINSNIKVNNSSIKGDSGAINISAGHSFSAAGTQLDGQIIGSGTIKLVNCHDGNFNPIPNR